MIRVLICLALFFIYVQSLSMQSAKAAILAGYDSDLTPNPVGGGPVLTNTQIFVNDIWGISHQNLQFQVDMYFRLWWNDSRLAYNETSVGLSSLIFVSDINRLWVPDIYVVNSVTLSTPSQALYVSPTGAVFWTRRLIMLLSCSMHFHDFPFDQQICPAIFSTYTHSGNEVRLAFKDPQVPGEMTALENTQWYIAPVVNGTVFEVFYFNPPVPYYEAYFNLTLTRYSATWVNKAVVPANLFVCLAMMNFWISSKAAPARTALGVITVLTMVNLGNSLASFLPNISYSTWMDDYLRAYLWLSVLALMEFAVVHYFFHQEENLRAETAKAKKEVEMNEMGTEALILQNTERRLHVIPFSPFNPSKPPLSPRIDFHCRWIFATIVIALNIYFFATANSPEFAGNF